MQIAFQDTTTFGFATRKYAFRRTLFNQL
jgi:hypothetical protein